MTDTTTAGDKPLNRRQLAKRRTAENVLRAARGGFEIQGYEKATIRSIAAAAGMSTGAVFANYADKAELYLAAFGHPPVSPETGRAAMIALGRILDATGDDWPDFLKRELGHAEDVLELAKFGRECRVPMPDAGAGFVHHALGQDGERVDVTPVGG